MTKPKTPTLASLAKRKGFALSKGESWISVDTGRPKRFRRSAMDVFFGEPGEPTREQALAMIHAALSVLPDVRKK